MPKEAIMSINKQDIEELRRIATNTYDNDKRFMYRVIQGIGMMETQINQLKAEVARLQK